MSMVEPLSPWAESHSDDAPPERQLSRLFSAVPAPAALPDAARQRVLLGLRTRAARGVRFMLLRLVVLGVIIGMTGAAAAQWATEHVFGSQREVVARPVLVVATGTALVPQPSLPQHPKNIEAPAMDPTP